MVLLSGYKYLRGQYAADRRYNANLSRRMSSRYGGRRTGYSGTSRRGVARLNPRTGGYLGLEKKFLDSVLAPTVIASASNWSTAMVDPTAQDCLNAPVQGNAENERIGRKMVVYSIVVLGNLHLTATIATTLAYPQPHGYFMALVLDKQTNGAQFDPSDVFDNPGANITNINRPVRNLEFIQRFDVLQTKYGTMQSNDHYTESPATGLDTHIQPVAKTWKLSHSWKSGKAFIMTGAGGNVSNCVDNSLHVICMSTQGTRTMSMDYVSRMRYVST